MDSADANPHASLRGSSAAVDDRDVSAAARMHTHTHTHTGAAVCFHLTGFGRFQGVDVNPTSQLIPILPDAFNAALRERASSTGDAPAAPKLDVCVCDHTVMDVCTAVCDRTLAGIRAACDACDASGCASGTDSAPTHIWLHFGVAASADHFALESCAVNDASFRVPDEAGYAPSGLPIDPEVPLGYVRRTRLPVEEMVAELARAGYPTEASTNAGKFLCNWCYFRSLAHTHGKENEQSLFIHVPSFDVAPLPKLTAFAVDVMLMLLDIARDGSEAWAAAHPACAAASAGRTAEQDAALLAAKSGDVRGGATPAAVSNGDAGVAATPATADLSTHVLAELLSMGFDEHLCREGIAALQARGGLSTETAAEWVVAAMEAKERASASPPAVSTPAAAGLSPSDFAQSLFSALAAAPRYKMVVVVRDDLNMGKGKIAAQVCHAALAAYRTGLRDASGKNTLQAWRSQGEPIVVVKCDNLASLQAIQTAARASGLPTHAIRDAGRTQVDPGTITVMAVGPATVESIDGVTGSLKLL